MLLLTQTTDETHLDVMTVDVAREIKDVHLKRLVMNAERGTTSNIHLMQE